MSLPKTMKNILRAQEILTVFFRHGFGDLVERLGLGQYLKSVEAREEAVERDGALAQGGPRRFR
jgi:hypothetical protein